MKSINPTTGAVLSEFPTHNDAEVEQRLSTARAAFVKHRRTSFEHRANVLRRAAEILQSEKRELGRMMTQEMGKTLSSAIAEVEKCATGCHYFADDAERHLAPERVKTEARDSYIAFQPIGVILAVMPWNFPFWQVFRFAAPALMAGNVGILKHASNVPQCALAIEDIFKRAGFSNGEFQTLLIESERVASVIDDPRIAAVTLTGSEAAGAAVAERAGKQIKKTVLELGGSDPFIVMPSADLGRAVKVAVFARNINNGQSCIAAKRFVVHEQIYNEFEAQFVKRMQSIAVGDPLDQKTQLGPLATRQIRDGLHDQVQRSVAAGAKLLTGGKPIDRPGFFYEPTVLTQVTPQTPAFHEELFGPVASLFRVANIDQAIELANATSFGLGSAAWTSDPDEQQRFINEIEAGLVFINGMVASDSRIPFGGVKRSGYGRELGESGIREFVNAKTVMIDAPIGGGID